MKQRALLHWTIGIVIAGIAIAAAFHFDPALAEFMSSHQTAGMRNFMVWVSRCGDWPEHVLVGLAVIAVAQWRGNKKWTRIMLAALIALSIAGLTGRVLKISTGRARPSVQSEHMWNGPRVSGSKYHSFPSGHVDASVGFFAVLLPARRRVGLACLAIPILIGFSRLYLGAHWLSDVVCGAVLGVLSAIVVVKFMKPRLERQESTPGRGD